MYHRLMFSAGVAAVRPVACAAVLAALGACATLTESTQQQVLVQTVLDHREVAGAGCVLSNDVGKWFIATPGRVTIRKSLKPLHVDCQLGGQAVSGESVQSKQNASLWGNIVLTFGTGLIVDRNTGAGFDYPSTITVILHPAHQGEQRLPAPGGVTVY
ncbi:hypothetical protein [Massilia sp. NR 4-1]|uniref:hypothetical protein n=1 Tax=Massilia sp. NR 4-1 TaxID=1678028 RepID=UPI00067D9D04|nr:hypothetical protein [Massilia sp. NR 4-1]